MPLRRNGGRQHGDADRPDRDVHRHERQRFRPAAAKSVTHGKQHVGNEGDQEDPQRQPPIVGNRLGVVAAEPRKDKDCRGREDDCVEHRQRAGQWKEVRVGLQDRDSDLTDRADRKRRRQHDERTRPAEAFEPQVWF